VHTGIGLPHINIASWLRCRMHRHGRRFEVFVYRIEIIDPLDS